MWVLLDIFEHRSFSSMKCCMVDYRSLHLIELSVATFYYWRHAYKQRRRSTCFTFVACYTKPAWFSFYVPSKTEWPFLSFLCCCKKIECEIILLNWSSWIHLQIPSVLANKHGPENRGMELEIKFIWSIASGKHQLFIDNICVSSSMLNHSTHQQRSTSKFDQTFNIPESILPGGHILQITAFASNLNLGGHPQHLLRLDGQVFNRFYSLYQLGSNNMMNTYGKVLENLKATGACRVAAQNESRNVDTKKIFF